MARRDSWGREAFQPQFHPVGAAPAPAFAHAAGGAALAESYFDPYIDYTGCVTGYAVTHMRIMGSYDWRFSRRNVWAVEHTLLGVRSRKIRRSRQRVKRERQKYRDYLAKYKKKPLYYRGREKWTEIPRHFL